MDWGIMPSSGFPGDAPVTVMVACGAGGTRRHEHPVTIGPATEAGGGWQLETGHDLESERIAMALGGGRVRCLDIIEHEIPAIHGYWRSLTRDVLAAIKPHFGALKAPLWQVVTPAAECECSSRRWTQPEQAAAHLRDLRHWCKATGAAYPSTGRLLRLLQTATGTASWSEEWAFAGYSRRVERETDLIRLWEAGIHPDVVAAVHDGLGLTDPLNAQAYLHIVTRRLDLEWLRPFVPGGAQAVTWAASTYKKWDERHPDDRLAWFRAGIHYNVITAVMGGYSLTDLRTLAEETGMTLNEAGHVMADWRQTSCRPSVTDMVRVFRLVPHGRQAPTPPALKAVLHRTKGSRGEMSTTEVGLVLVAAGTTPGAVALIGRGVRSLDEFEARQLVEGRR